MEAGKDSKDKEEVYDEELNRAMNKEVKKLFTKWVTDTFASLDLGTTARRPPDNTDEEIPIYEKLSPGEVFIISRSKKGVLVAANCDGECDIRYYNDSEE